MPTQTAWLPSVSSAPVGKGHYKQTASVRPSVCRVPPPKSRMERHRKPKIVRKPITLVTCESISRSKGQRSRSPGRLMLRPKVHHIFRISTNFKLGRRLEHALSTATASYKGLRSFVIARGRGHTVSAAPLGHTTCLNSSSPSNETTSCHDRLQSSIATSMIIIEVAIATS